MKQMIKTIGTVIALFVLIFTVNQSYANVAPLADLINNEPDPVFTEGLFIPDIFCDDGALSVMVENGGDHPIDPDLHGSLYIWIDGELEWTYSWSTWSCQNFRLPGKSCVIQPQYLDDGEHLIEAQLLDENGQEIDFMEAIVHCGESMDDPGDTPEPDPGTVEGNCVSADRFYQTADVELSMVHMGPIVMTEATLPDGTPVDLQITDCSNDDENTLNVFVPWSESNALDFATIAFTQMPCPNGFPQVVEITLQHGNEAKFVAYQSDGTQVDSVTAADHSNVQTVALFGADGIEKIEIVGSEICIINICWECVREGGPEDPECPPEVLEAAYQAGYEAGLAAARAADETTDTPSDDMTADPGTCGSFDIFTGLLTVPCVGLEGIFDANYSLEMKLIDAEVPTFELIHANVNN